MIDLLDETHEVLRTAFASRGVEVVAARDCAQGLALARRHHPDLVVLDSECDSQTPALAGRLSSESAARSTPLLILGTTRRQSPRPAACQFLPKPYHYAPLIRKIEELLESPQAASRQRVARAA